MPTGPDGQYIPIDNLTKEAIVDYMANLLRQGRLTDREIVNQAGQRFGLENEDFLPAYSLLRTAQREVQAGEDANQNPNVPLDPSDIPTGPGDPAQSGRYSHDILIIYRNPATGETFTVRERIESDSPLSQFELLDYAQEQIDQLIQQGSPRPRPGTDPSSFDTQVIILGVHRVA